MADKIFENNQVTIAGKIVSDFVFSHEVYGEGFYMIRDFASKRSFTVNRLFADITVQKDLIGFGVIREAGR